MRAGHQITDEEGDGEDEEQAPETAIQRFRNGDNRLEPRSDRLKPQCKSDDQVSESNVSMLSALDTAKEQAMTADIYSLMTSVGVCTVSFWFAIWTFIAQASITVLVFVDLVVLGSSPPSTNGTTNRMMIPADAPMPVTAAQFFGVGLIVNFAAAQGDIMSGFAHLLHGFDPDIQRQNRHITRFKWYLAGILQFFVGAVLVIDLAILLMQSTSNIMLCLNFAALHFVQDIDDVSFSMGQMGLISRRVQRACERISTISVRARKQRRNNIYKRIFLLLLAIGLYSFYFMVVGWQWNGRFMCHSVFVQFGDDFGKEWPLYSSVFTTPSTKYQYRTEGRVVYIEPTETIILAYCGAERAWTFSYIADDNHCNYFIKSTETASFDIMDIAGREWFAQTEDLGEVPMDFLSVTCNDCNQELCSPEVGTCVDNKCLCNEDRMGINCEFIDDDEHLCEFMALDRRTKGDMSSLSFAGVFMRKTYRRLKVDRDGHNIEQIYNRPFYISAYSGDRSKIETFIVFSGYRWIMYGLPQEAPREATIQTFEDFLISTKAHMEPLEALQKISEQSLFIPLFFSSPIQYETRSHDVEPLTARWVLAAIDDSLPLIGAYPDIDHPVSASFLCSKCNNETNPCLNDGVCGGYKNPSSTECNCNATGIKSYGGFLCEYAYGCDERPELARNCRECDKIFKICTRCDRGYYGNLCQFKRNFSDWVEMELEVDESGEILDGHFTCLNSTCKNGGYCTNSVEACKCPGGFRGPLCDIALAAETSTLEDFICTNSTCLRGGVCTNTSGSCLCPAQYTGPHCEFLLPTNLLSEGGPNTTAAQTGPDSLIGELPATDSPSTNVNDADLETGDAVSDQFLVNSTTSAATVVTEPDSVTDEGVSGMILVNNMPSNAANATDPGSLDGETGADLLLANNTTQEATNATYPDSVNSETITDPVLANNTTSNATNVTPGVDGVSLGHDDDYSLEQVFDACLNHDNNIGVGRSDKSLCDTVCKPSNCCFDDTKFCPETLDCKVFAPCQVLHLETQLQVQSACNGEDVAECVRICATATCCFTNDIQKICDLTNPNVICKQYKACEILYTAASNVTSNATNVTESPLEDIAVDVTATGGEQSETGEDDKDESDAGAVLSQSEFSGHEDATKPEERDVPGNDGTIQPWQ